jgi:UDP-N-acetylmuramate dehydrogenase
MIQIKENISLKPFNSFGIDVLAKQFCTVRSFNEVQALLEWNKTKK